MSMRFAHYSALLLCFPLMSFAAKPLEIQAPIKENDIATVSFDRDGGINFTSRDGEITSRLWGFIAVQAVDFSGDTKDTVNNTQNLYNGVTIPEARLEWSGSYEHDWEYRFEYEFADTEIKAAYLRYIGFNHIELTTGQYKPAFSGIGNITSKAYKIFSENPLPSLAFVPDYLLGAQAQFYVGSQWAFALGVVAPSAGGSVNGVSIGHSADPVGTTTRLSVAPIDRLHHVLYMDIGNYFSQTVQGQYVQFHAIPEMAARNNTYLVTTGVIDNSRYFDVSSTEVGGVAGPFFADAGYYLTNVNQVGSPSLVFDGYAAEFGYFFTGESREFDVKQGEFTDISPVRNRYGAWQMALRYSYVNLMSEQIMGGREGDASVVLNWYPRNRFKMGLEYIYASATPSANGLDRHANIAALMVQTIL